MRTVLITGGTKGIGAGIATHLRGNTDFKVITCARNQSADIQCDVTDRAQVERMRAEIGPLGILINNVGGVRTAPFLKIDEQEWDWHVNVNLKSVYLCTRAFLPSMIDNKWGRIINIASTAGKIGGRYISAYVAAKHAVIGLTQSLALEYAESGVTINAVCPSFVDTPMLREGAKRAADRTGKSVDQIMEQIRNMNPQKRFVTTQEVADAVLFLIQNGGVNGQALSICGGETNS
jgi:NAD(P)-dependent dehydrogenase (short-subunit alcohol dehydrogenase family)